MKLKTRDFGEIEIEESEIITFEQPVFGFEDYHKYVIIHEENTKDKFVWLQSIEEPQLCFILANIISVNKEIHFEISDDVINTLGKCDNYDIWFVMVVNEDIKKTTVNLKSPIIINAENKTAVQFITDSDLPIRHLLFCKDGKENK